MDLCVDLGHLLVSPSNDKRIQRWNKPASIFVTKCVNSISEEVQVQATVAGEKTQVTVVPSTPSIFFGDSDSPARGMVCEEPSDQSPVSNEALVQATVVVQKDCSMRATVAAEELMANRNSNPETRGVSKNRRGPLSSISKHNMKTRNSEVQRKISEEELNSMQVLKRGQDYIEVRCGCTSQKYGDYIGKLKVTMKEEMTPYDFDKHSQRVGPRKWKDHIWVILNDEQGTSSEQDLSYQVLQTYMGPSNEVSTNCRDKRNFHREEFVTCSLCEKEHRFRLRTKEDCMIYHASAADKKWKCSDRPYDR
ncbi:hypothetical protein Q3G72_001981 [Acer saccharum]|nr:hypothetical protein Q3G72_001981 [Acer saccharum]